MDKLGTPALYVIAYSDAAKGSPSWAMIDPYNPYAGVQLTVLGDPTGCPTTSTPRRVVINFKCDPNATQPPTTFTAVENPTCVESITLTTAAGCPVTGRLAMQRE
jgi:hypothetical protein